MSIKVAVRVRPFSIREIELDSGLCIAMTNNKTTLLNLKDPNKNRDFNFDYQIWSHSGFFIDEIGERLAQDDKYCSQRGVYDLVGSQILNNAWEGFHCNLIAYGQPGAGKSYSLAGTKPNRGIVSIACEEIFKRISMNQENSTEYEVGFSMLEIYNEQVQDLLIPFNKRSQGGSRIREDKINGFYVENLSKYPVKSYGAIEHLLEQGYKNRTIASTQMNNISSRGHTIFRVEFRKREMTNGKQIETSSLINFVDLVGSERFAIFNPSAKRIKEGYFLSFPNIIVKQCVNQLLVSLVNKSLQILGLVIRTLAEIEGGKKIFRVPYRDSCLTKIICNAFGGNSKTLMICAISPSNNDYNDTLSTLRCAEQAQKINNKTVKNINVVSINDQLVKV